MSDDIVPGSPTGYQPVLPKIDGLPEGMRIDPSHFGYKQAAEQAHKAGLTQRQFSAFLGFEAQRVHAATKAASAPPPPSRTAAPAPAAPAPAPKPAAPAKPYSKMTMTEKLNHFGHR